MIPDIEPLENNEEQKNIGNTEPENRANCTSTNTASVGTKVARTAAQTAMLMAILTLGSKLLGFVREMVMAACFGTSFVVDAYVMAQAIPGIITTGFFMAIDTAFMPLFSKITENEGENQGNKFTSEVICLVFAIATVFSIFGFIFSDQLVSIFALNFKGQVAELTGFYLKITFAYLFFTSTAGVIETMLRYRGVFLAPIIIGYSQNIIIITMILISARFDYHYLAYGMLLAFVVRLLLLSLISKRKSFNFEFSFKLGTTAKKILALSLPVFIGSSINQINFFVDKTLASGLPEGSISALNYGSILMGLITGLTVSIIMTVIYPKMTQAQALDNQEHFNQMVGTGFNLICIITMPCTLGAIAYSNQIVQIIYERGAFDSTSTSLTGMAFLFYSVGLIFSSLNSLFIQAYYSMHDMKTPMIFGAVGVIINIVLNLILVRYLAHGGLAFATSIAAICNTMLLYYGMKKKHSKVVIVRKVKDVIKVIVAAVVAVGSSLLVYYLVIMPMVNIIFMRVVQLGIAVAVAGVVYLVMLKVFRIEELKLLKQLIRK